MKSLIVIASAFRATSSAVNNASRSVNASKALDAIGLTEHQSALGYYKGEGQAEGSTELSFVIPITGEGELVEQRFKEVMDLFLGHFEQDCIMLVNPTDYSARLLFKDGSELELGYFQEVDMPEATSAQAYTQWQDKYWVCKE